MIIGWFPSLVTVPSVVWLQSASYSKSTSWVVPLIFYGSQCRLAPTCFPHKINSLCGSLYFLWFPVLFGSKVLSTQNQHFGCFPSLVMVPSVVWLQRVFHSKSTVWVVPFTFHGSLCCLVPSVVWLQYAFHSKSTF